MSVTTSSGFAARESLLAVAAAEKLLPQLAVAVGANEAVELLVSRAPHGCAIRQVVLFEGSTWSDRLRSIAAVGLTASQERLYRSTGREVPSPIVSCWLSGKRVAEPFDDSLAAYSNWAPYHDDLAEGDVLQSQMFCEPIFVSGVAVGVLFVVAAIRETDIDFGTFLGTLAPAFGLIAAAAGYCRMWDPACNELWEPTLLSMRQRQILVRVGDNLKNPEIATALNVSEGTVKNDLTAAFRFLGVSGRQDAVRVARLNGYLAGVR